MTEKQKKILANINAMLPKLTALEQEKLLSFSEGMAFMVAQQSRSGEQGREHKPI